MKISIRFTGAEEVVYEAEDDKDREGLVYIGLPDF